MPETGIFGSTVIRNLTRRAATFIHHLMRRAVPSTRPVLLCLRPAL
jgi:hypothetical protein